VNGIQRVEKYVPDEQERTAPNETYVRPSGHIVVVSDYLGNSLYDIATSSEFRKMTAPETLDLVFNISTQLVNIFSVLHQLTMGARSENGEWFDVSFVHGDVKRQNVALDSFGRVHIIDFDRASGEHGYSQPRGTAFCESPDWYDGSKFKIKHARERKHYNYRKDAKADMWAVGHMILRMIDPHSLPDIFLPLEKTQHIQCYTEVPSIFGVPDPRSMESKKREIRDPREPQQIRFRNQQAAKFEKTDWAWAHVKKCKGIKEYLNDEQGEEQDKVSFMKSFLTHFMAFENEDRYTAHQFRSTFLMDYKLKWWNTSCWEHVQYEHFKLHAQDLIERHLWLNTKFLHEANVRLSFNLRKKVEAGWSPNDARKFKGLISPEYKLLDFSKEHGLIYEVRVRAACAKGPDQHLNLSELYGSMKTAMDNKNSTEIEKIRSQILSRNWRKSKKGKYAPSKEAHSQDENVVNVPVPINGQETVQKFIFQIGGFTDVKMMFSDWSFSRKLFRDLPEEERRHPYANVVRSPWYVDPDPSKRGGDNSSQELQDYKNAIHYKVYPDDSERKEKDKEKRHTWSCPFCAHTDGSLHEDNERRFISRHMKSCPDQKKKTALRKQKAERSGKDRKRKVKNTKQTGERNRALFLLLEKRTEHGPKTPK